MSDRRTKKLVPALYYKDLECVPCSLFKYNNETDEWDRSKNTPRKGDHVVVDGTEMVKIGDDEYRDLAKFEQDLWDFSIPDESELEDLPFLPLTFNDIPAHKRSIPFVLAHKF